VNPQSALHALQDAFDAEAFGRSYGLRAESVAASMFSSKLAVEPRHQLEAGTFMHGGCIAALCEQTNRYAARTLLPEGTPAVTTELQSSYLAGASGRHLVCRASVVAVAQHGFIVDCTVHSGPVAPSRLVTICRSTVAAMDRGMPAWANAVSRESSLGHLDVPADDEWHTLIQEDYGQGWRRFCGMRPSKAARGIVEISHAVDARHLDADGCVLPGLIAPFADDVGGACAYSTGSPGERMATLDLTLSILNRPMRARALLGRARTIKAGKTVVVSKVDIIGLTPQREELLATSLVTVTRVPGHERVLSQLPLAAAAVPEPAPNPTEGAP
jgi:acyl-coenzyme A thioesterase PaaI-like protein